MLARSVKKALKQAAESLKGKPASSENEEIYKGINNYKDYKAGFRREQTIASEKAGGAHGPLRAAAHIRVSARFDYQPDICKDHKETGYCGYGDEEVVDVSDEDDDDSLPFACFICRKPCVGPVVTKCQHCFCEHCALKHHAKNKKCFVCNQQTLGIFNVAHVIRRKMAEDE